MLDAMAGYSEAESDRIKALASVMRTATTKLWNIQVALEDKMTEEDLWPFPWEKAAVIEKDSLTDEQSKEFQERQNKFLNERFPL